MAVAPGTEPKVHDASTYKNYKCHCEECTLAHRLKSREDRERRFATRTRQIQPSGYMVLVADREEHNQSTYNNWGCRCDECSRDHNRKNQGLSSE